MLFIWVAFISFMSLERVLGHKDKQIKRSLHKVLSSQRALSQRRIYQVQNFIAGYARDRLEKIVSGEIKVPPEERAGLISRLGKIDEWMKKGKRMSDKKLYQDETKSEYGTYSYDRTLDSDTDLTKAHLCVIFNRSYKACSVSFYKPKDSYKKIRRMAEEADICWDNEADKELYSKGLARDCTKNGGSIVYLVRTKRGKRHTRHVSAFVRCFLGVDNKSRPYLFIDLIEGRFGSESFIHRLDYWGDPKYKPLAGIFKTALFTAIAIAKDIDAEYVVTEDEGIEDLFSGIGAGRIRTDGEYSHKIGSPASETPENKDEVKSYFFGHNGREYGLYLQSLSQKKAAVGDEKIYALQSRKSAEKPSIELETGEKSRA